MPSGYGSQWRAAERHREAADGEAGVFPRTVSSIDLDVRVCAGDGTRSVTSAAIAPWKHDLCFQRQHAIRAVALVVSASGRIVGPLCSVAVASATLALIEWEKPFHSRIEMQRTRAL